MVDFAVHPSLSVFSVFLYRESLRVEVHALAVRRGNSGDSHVRECGWRPREISGVLGVHGSDARHWRGASWHGRGFIPADGEGHWHWKWRGCALGKAGSGLGSGVGGRQLARYLRAGGWRHVNEVLQWKGLRTPVIPDHRAGDRRGAVRKPPGDSDLLASERRDCAR